MTLNRVELVACDPNQIAGTPSLAGVDVVIETQAARLAGGSGDESS